MLREFDIGGLMVRNLLSEGRNDVGMFALLFRIRFGLGLEVTNVALMFSFYST